jgi:multimeric flavodoxin WrbA
MAVKVAVIYYSTYGTNHAIAEIAAEAARAAGAEVKVLRAAETAPADVVNGQDAWKAAAEKQSHIPVVTPADMEWADAYFFCTPTRYGQAASQMRAFIDTLGGVWFQGKLAGKAITATSLGAERPRRARGHHPRPLHHLLPLGLHHRAAGLYRRLDLRRGRQPLWLQPHPGPAAG